MGNASINNGLYVLLSCILIIYVLYLNGWLLQIGKVASQK